MSDWTVRYFLSLAGGPKREVTKLEWVAAERSAGFYPKWVASSEPATGGFSNGSISGSLEYVPADAPADAPLADVVDLTGGTDEEWSYTYRHHPKGEPGGDRIVTGWDGGDVHPDRESLEGQLALWERMNPGGKHDVTIVRRTVTYGDWKQA